MDEYIGTILPIHTDKSDRPITGTVFCDGGSLPLDDPEGAYKNLFSLIGTTYGGNGVSSFQVPDLRSLESGRRRYVIVTSGRFPTPRPDTTGVVRDGNLVWLKKANYTTTTRDKALSIVQGLDSRLIEYQWNYGLNDGSQAGDWRLATTEELLARAKNLAGFPDFSILPYWTLSDPDSIVGMLGGGLVKKANLWPDGSTIGKGYAYWPVRSA